MTKTPPCHILYPFSWHAFLQISFPPCAYMETEKIWHYCHAEAECLNIVIHYIWVFSYVYFDECIYNFMFIYYKAVLVVFHGKVIWTVFRQHSISVYYLTFSTITCIRFKSLVACFLICYVRQSCCNQLPALDLISCLGCITLNGGINLQCKIWQFFL